MRGSSAAWWCARCPETNDQRDWPWTRPAGNGAALVGRGELVGSDALEDFEGRTFAVWDRASLHDLRRAIDRRRREFDRDANRP